MTKTMEKLNAAIKYKEKPKKQAIKRIFLLCPAGIFLAVFIFWQGFLRSKPLAISPETTLITKPLAVDGGIDYFAYMESRLPKEIGTDANGFRVVCREIGIPEEIRLIERENPKLFQIFCEKLDIDPHTEPLTILIDHYAAWNDWATERYRDLSCEELEQNDPSFIQNDMDNWFANYTEDRRLFTEMWGEKNSPALDILVRELQKEIFVCPIVRNDEFQRLEILATTLRFVRIQRYWARELRFHALWRLHQGDIEGALADQLAVKRLARTVQQNPNGFLFESMIGMALEGIGASIGIGANSDAPPTRDQWQRLMDDVQKNEGVFSLKNSLQNEQLFVLEIIQRCADAQKGWIRKNPFSRKEPLGELCIILGADWSELARRLNRAFYDCTIDNSETLFNGLTQNNSELNGESISRYLSLLKLLTLKGRTDYFFKFLTGLFFPCMEGANAASRRLNCQRNLTKIDLALHLYASDHDGKLPPAWTVDENGKPLHSWRTLILPYLGPEAKEVYCRIKLDEPWNSESNKHFHQHNIPEYLCPEIDFYYSSRGDGCSYPKPGETTYSVIVGPDTPFGVDGIGRDIGARCSLNGHPQILVVERCDPVIWMKPDSEITQEAAQLGINFTSEAVKKNRPKKGLPGSPVSFHTYGINAAMADGSIRFFSENGEDALKIYLTHLLSSSDSSVK